MRLPRWVATVYLSAALLGVWLIPYQPRHTVATGAAGVNAVSPCGRYALLYRIEHDDPQAQIVNISEDDSRCVAFVVDTETARSTQLGEVFRPFEDGVLPAEFLPDVFADAGYLRRLHARAGTPLADGVLLPAAVASADGRYWAVRIDRWHKAFAVREVESGRVVLSVPNVASDPAFGPGGDVSVVTDVSDPRADRCSYRFERWDVATGRRIDARPLSMDGCHSPRLTADGRYVLAWVSDEPKLRVIATATGDAIPIPPAVERPDGNLAHEVVYAHGVYVASPADRTLALWQPATTRVSTVTFPPGVWTGLTAANVAADGSALAVQVTHDALLQRVPWPWLQRALFDSGVCAWSDDETRLVETATGREFARLADAGDSAFAADGRSLAVVGRKGDLRVYDWPLRRPWPLILGVAAVPAALVGLAGFALRCFRRRRAAT